VHHPAQAAETTHIHVTANRQRDAGCCAAPATYHRS
jgi:hypothetical protein